VWARIVWSWDGEQWMYALATRWTDWVVFVEFGDPALRRIGVWVKLHDVRRRRQNWFRRSPIAEIAA
jgi:hypothetical protein